VASETVIEGPVRFDTTLAEPLAVRKVYHDIVVLACPAPEPDAEGQVPSDRELQFEQVVCRWPGFRRGRAVAAVYSHQIPVAGHSALPMCLLDERCGYQQPHGRAGGACNGTCRPGAGWF